MFVALGCQRLLPALVRPMNQLQIRLYAISRFPKRIVGSGRERRKSSLPTTVLSYLIGHDIARVKSRNLTENDVSGDMAPALKHSAFTTEPHPDDSGLSKLLMYRDTLIIER